MPGCPPLLPSFLPNGLASRPREPGPWPTATPTGEDLRNAWSDALRLCEAAGIGSIREFDDRGRG